MQTAFAGEKVDWELKEREAKLAFSSWVADKVGKELTYIDWEECGLTEVYDFIDIPKDGYWKPYQGESSGSRVVGGKVYNGEGRLVNQFEFPCEHCDFPVASNEGDETGKSSPAAEAGPEQVDTSERVLPGRYLLTVRFRNRDGGLEEILLGGVLAKDGVTRNGLFREALSWINMYGLNACGLVSDPGRESQTVRFELVHEERDDLKFNSMCEVNDAGHVV